MNTISSAALACFMLALPVSVPAQTLNNWNKVDTLTAGDCDDLNPSLVHNVFLSYPSRTIRYSLPVRCNVVLSVFNTLGQRVAILADEEQEAGYYDVRFDGSMLASGVYFYRLEAGDFVQSRRLVILK